MTAPLQLMDLLLIIPGPNAYIKEAHNVLIKSKEMLKGTSGGTKP